MRPPRQRCTRRERKSEDQNGRARPGHFFVFRPGVLRASAGQPACLPARAFGRASSPLFFAARGRRLPVLALGQCRGDGAPKGASSRLVSRTVAGAWRLSALHRGVCAAPGRASCLPLRPAVRPSAPVPLSGLSRIRASSRPRGRPSASSSQGIVLSPGGAPAPPGDTAHVRPRPRAPHRRCRVYRYRPIQVAPSSKRPAKTPSAPSQASWNIIL